MGEKTKKKSGFGKFLLLGALAGLAALVVAAWKASTPVEDPWQNVPADPELQRPLASRDAQIDEVRKAVSDES